ncbi:MAG TPA: hypothetical protein VFP22_08725, partial [Candidatus Limnocylindrales bacterium]|nr:hypothetical protein [Candidatus Limnocylindrales bacterium]
MSALPAVLAAAATVVAGHRAAAIDGRVVAALAAGVIAGLALLIRGFAGYRTADRIGGIAPSRIASLAVGEVLVTGTAETIELTLVSPLQSAPCLYYRSRVTDRSERGGVVFREERAVGFRVRDETGAIRVFPAGARFDVPDRYDEQTGLLDSSPTGLVPRTGSVFGPGSDRASQIAALLTVHGGDTAGRTAAGSAGSGSGALTGGGGGFGAGAAGFGDALAGATT